MVAFTTNDLADLPIYYKRLFPFDLFCSWLSYGSENYQSLAHREMSFTLPGDVYIRYQSFDSPQDFEQEVIKKCPEKIDIGAIYNIKPRQKRMNTNFEVEEKELVFDIDMTDYDNVRTCCSEAEICTKCWRLLTVAVEILDTALREDFGFEHMLWVFSGRRGVHCWVCDDTARKLEPKVRADIAEYLQLLSTEDSNGKLAHIPHDRIHPSIKRAIEIIEPKFETMCVTEQNILGSHDSAQIVLRMLGDQSLRDRVQSTWDDHSLTNSLDRWRALVTVYKDMYSKNLLRKHQNLIEEIMLHYAYPRLDIEVSKGSNHLLKAPFCIHPKTGKVCIPFNPSSSDTFNPLTVPTISTLIAEIEKQETIDLEETSMSEGVRIFSRFLSSFKNDKKRDTVKSEGMDF